ncbi:TetR/AcrR family transcriptional regulator [Streptomyces sp. NPDC051917]|uniref:TetR/AcrR family transcriptional regulator n=1 Tax=Streptomyces sp. NPDC051917 TaxID=3154754 RepID=UPI00344FE62F
MSTPASARIRSAGMIDRLARWVRGRPEGESAAAAVLRELREEVEAVSPPRVGLLPGYAAFMKVIEEAPALRSRLWAIGQEVQAGLEQALREETGAADDDELPHLMASQIGWIHSTVIAVIGREMVKGREPCEVSREVLALLDDIEDLLGERVLSHAVRTAA